MLFFNRLWKVVTALDIDELDDRFRDRSFFWLTCFCMNMYRSLSLECLVTMIVEDHPSKIWALAVLVDLLVMNTGH